MRRAFPALGKFERAPTEFDPDGRGTDCDRIAGLPPRFISVPWLGTDMRPALGRSTLAPLGRAILDRWPFSTPGRMPAPFIPPALGGRGTERPHMPPLLLRGMDPRSAFPGAGRWLLIGPLGRCAPPFQFGREPIPYPAFPVVFRIPVPAVARLIMGREKLCGGGAAALIPAFAPSREVMVGFMSNE